MVPNFCTLGTSEALSSTALSECQHYFCDGCWEAHLKTQISKNTTKIMCPEYKCDCPVDTVTMMSLIPSWYNKYVSRSIDKAFEMSPQWKRCPSDHCHLVVKATIPSGKKKEAFPVACCCGALWCFECRQQAHWPIACEEARKFYEATCLYWDSIHVKSNELISSVFVRKCPQCHYPIEKHLGCNFMYCVLCHTSFCWDCMTPWDVHGDKCKKKVTSEEFDLTLDNQSNRFAKYMNMVKHHNLARHTPLVSHQKRHLQHLHENVRVYQSLDSTTRTSLQQRSKHNKGFMEDAVTNGAPEALDTLFQFKFEAHFTLEGAAKLAAMSKKTEKQTRKTLHQLQFILERIEDLQKGGLSSLMRKTNLDKLSHWIECGKRCMYSLGKSASRRK